MDLKVCLALVFVTLGSAAEVEKPEVNSSFYPTGCMLCYTCGGSYPYHVASVDSGHTFLELGSGCSGSIRETHTDNPYACCSYTGLMELSQQRKKMLGVQEPPAEPKIEEKAVVTETKEKSNALSPLNSCRVCYTCGAGYTVIHAILRTDSWYEFGSGCSGSTTHFTSSDNAYICCNYYADDTVASNATVLI